MPRACVLLADGFEEIEAVTIVDVLRRAEVETETLRVGGVSGADGGLEVTGSHGLTLRADRTLADGSSSRWDIVILPGGLPGATNLRDDPETRAFIKTQHAAGGRLGAICAAPIALGAAGVLEGRKATSYPGFENELRGATCVAERVVRDGGIVTSRGPGTALEFALEIVADLCGPATAKELRAGMLVDA